MAFDFPNSPAIGDEFQRWRWNGQRWKLKSSMPDDFVLKAGDTMTGALTVRRSAATQNPAIILDREQVAGDLSATITGELQGVNRWRVVLGDATAETGANAGSDFRLQRATDAGVFSDAFIVNRATAVTTWANAMTINY